MTASMTLGVRATSSVDQKIVDSKRTLKGQSMKNNQHTHIEVKLGRKFDLKIIARTVNLTKLSNEM